MSALNVPRILQGYDRYVPFEPPGIGESVELPAAQNPLSLVGSPATATTTIGGP